MIGPGSKEIYLHIHGYATTFKDAVLVIASYARAETGPVQHPGGC